MKVRGQYVYELPERLNRLADVRGPADCWNWRSATRNGYGRLMIGSRAAGTRRSVSAHRLAYEIHFGEIPSGLEVCHRCDNRRCINPAHLFVGTKQDNVDDREAKGRNKIMRGENNGNAKLDQAKIARMRELRASGMTFAGIAKLVGVDKKTAMRAIKGQSYVVPPAPQDGKDLMGGQGGLKDSGVSSQCPTTVADQKERCRAWVPGSKPGDPPPDCPPRRCTMNAGHEGRHFDGCQYFTPRQFDAPEQWRES